MLLGVDIGGTFTDFVVYRPATGELRTFKLLSTPHDPAEAVLQGIQQALGSDPAGLKVIHGSTVATNALLERKGARTAFIATRGFKDILQIGRQNRPALYDFNADPPPPLCPKELRFEVDERVDAQGEVLQALDPAQVEALIPELQKQGAVSIAICLLFSFLHPAHERKIAEIMRAAGFFVSSSSEILPEYREYERASTTAVNAYVSPVLERYLSHLEQALPSAHLRVMQSNGGAISLGEARRQGVRCILSGPAGGVVGAKHVAELALLHQPATDEAHRVRIIAFDMGGTSTDVSLIDGQPEVTTEAVVSGCPIRLPVLDIHTIGAGGGSIAYVDAGGALRVGPQSAGAEPGPACYGKGVLPTVTDANLVLGRLAAEHFLGGQMPLNYERALGAMKRLGEQAGLDAYQAALGVIAVVNAHMERALRVISVERGYDPQGGSGLPPFTLLSFGGAGGLHAADLARNLGIPRLLVPPLASTLSAFGMLAAEIVKDYTQTVMLEGNTPLEQIATLLKPLAERGLQEVQAEGLPAEQIHLEQRLDMRYRGQSYELTLPFSQKLLDDFHCLHRQAYGYALPEAPMEIVNLRVRAVGHVQPPLLEQNPVVSPDPSPALLDYRPVIFSSGRLHIPLYRGESLQPANSIPGPALIVRSDTTILIGPSDQALIDSYCNLMVDIGPA